MSITWAKVTAIAAELSTTSAEAQTEILAYVNDEAIHDETWRDAAKADRARQYLAAHMGALALPGRGANGPVIGESAGPVSRQYGVTVAAGASDFEATSYGKVYRRLVRQQFGGPHSV
jgi:membrane protein involved in colicin uptake